MLPIVGHVVSELHLRAKHSPRLVFSDDQSNVSYLDLESALMTLSRNGEELVLDSLLPGKEFDSRSFSPLVDLLDCSVLDAIATRRGALRLNFSEGWHLSAVPCCYEGWHFWTEDLSLHGADGHLI